MGEIRETVPDGGFTPRNLNVVAFSGTMEDAGWAEDGRR